MPQLLQTSCTIHDIVLVHRRRLLVFDYASGSTLATHSIKAFTASRHTENPMVSYFQVATGRSLQSCDGGHILHVEGTMVTAMAVCQQGRTLFRPVKLNMPTWFRMKLQSRSPLIFVRCPFRSPRTCCECTNPL